MSQSRVGRSAGTSLILLAWALAMSMISCSSTAPRAGASLVITNAKVWTADPAHPDAEAVAVLGERIVAVGSRAEVDQWKTPDTQVIDAGGKSVLPGFDDAHVHFIMGGMQLDSVDLKSAGSPDEFARRISERAKANPGEWVLGGDWDETSWNPPALPTRELIDGATGETPVFVNRYDGHMALANSAALRRAGVTAKSADPPGGAIVRDARGNPTGILKDAAMSYVNKVIPPPSPERLMRAAQRAMEYAASQGVTSVQDMGPNQDEMRLYAELADRRQLTTRIYAVPLETGWQDQARIGIRHAFGSSYLRIGGIKGFADGSLGSTTAYFFEPYTDAPDTRGLLSDEMQPIEGMRDRLTQGDKAGLQLCIHAIGDQANSIVLDIFESIIKANGDSDRRFRIEHAQHIAPKDFDRFAQLKVIASVQPYHAIDDGRWAEKRIGPERAKTTYAFRTFLDRKVAIAFGSDWPVAPMNPIMGIYAATTRQTLDGKHPEGWIPEQKISVQDAIAAYTTGAAYAEFQERDKGSLVPGKLADLVVLSGDIFAVDPAAIKDLKVEATILGGKTIYTAPR